MELEQEYFDSAVKAYLRSCERSNEIFQQPSDYRVRDFDGRTVMTLFNNYGDIAEIEFVKGKPKRIA